MQDVIEHCYHMRLPNHHLSLRLGHLRNFSAPLLSSCVLVTSPTVLKVSPRPCLLTAQACKQVGKTGRQAGTSGSVFSKDSILPLTAGASRSRALSLQNTSSEVPNPQPCCLPTCAGLPARPLHTPLQAAFAAPLPVSLAFQLPDCACCLYCISR